MARPNYSQERREKLIPVIARMFAELGYRRATTAELAKRCGVRENILFRLWPDKKGMFLASVDYVYALSASKWQDLLKKDGSSKTAAERLLEYESEHHGEYRLYRIVFAGLNEIDDPEICEALSGMYGRFHNFIRDQLAAHRRGMQKKVSSNVELLAWAFIGLGTMADITKELGLATARRHKELIMKVGKLLLDANRK
jgi:AcrR family transcriptional regulator